MHLAILGASGHIGMNLVERFAKLADYKLYLFSRDLVKMQDISAKASTRAEILCVTYPEFGRSRYDAVINCIGIADPKMIRKAGRQIFRTTEEFDNLVLCYIEKNSGCRYVNMSSGAAYGLDFSQPIDDAHKACYSINPVHKDEYYGIAKLYAEAKHRAYDDLGIVDLRIFGFFSKHIDIDGGFLLSDAARCLLKGQRMMTDNSDILRDYVHPDDLFQLVQLCIDGERRNIGLDVYSDAPVSKFALLHMLQREFGLRFDKMHSTGSNATDTKSQYYTLSRRASSLGYVPKYRAIDAVRQEMRLLLEGSKAVH